MSCSGPRWTRRRRDSLGSPLRSCWTCTYPASSRGGTLRRKVHSFRCLILIAQAQNVTTALERPKGLSYIPQDDLATFARVLRTINKEAKHREAGATLEMEVASLREELEIAKSSADAWRAKCEGAEKDLERAREQERARVAAVVGVAGSEARDSETDATEEGSKDMRASAGPQAEDVERRSSVA